MKKSILYIGIVAVTSLFIGCQDMERPVLGEYEADPIIGDLKMHMSFEGSLMDSTNYLKGTTANTTYGEGVKGQAMIFNRDQKSNAIFSITNGLERAKSLSIAFWMKAKNPAPASDAQFVFSLPSTEKIWHSSEAFLMFEDGGQSNKDSMAAKFLIQDQWVEFIKNAEVGDRRLKVLDDKWHHLAFVYDEATSKLTCYVDGKAHNHVGNITKQVDGKAVPRGALSITKATKFTLGGPAYPLVNGQVEGWMGYYTGSLDEFRTYAKALSAAEVTALYTNKR